MNSPLQETPQLQTILLVEDNDSYRQIVAASLARALPDCQIIQADSVISARAVVPVEALDVAVLDMTLPDGMATDIIDGWQAHMKKGLRVLVFSSYEPEEVAPALLALGVHEYVNKERGMRPLIQSVQAVIEGLRREKGVQISPAASTMRTDGASQS